MEKNLLKRMQKKMLPEVMGMFLGRSESVIEKYKKEN